MALKQVRSSLFSSSNPFKRAVAALETPEEEEEEEEEEESQEEEEEEESQEEEEEEEESQGEGDGEEEEEEKWEEPRYDSHEKLQRTIFVGNLPLNTKKKVLIRRFSCFGDVESARLRSVPIGTAKMSRRGAVITGNVSEHRSSLNAYVVFKDVESATSALTCNMSEFEGKHIRVDLAGARSQLSRGAVSYDKTRSLFVGNLPVDVEDEELYALFSRPDVELEAVRVVRDNKTNIGKGFAFVLFKTKDDVKRTLGRGPLEVRNRKVRLHRVTGAGSGVPEGRSRPPRRQRPTTYRNVGAGTYEGVRSGHKKRAPVQRLASVAKAAKSEGNARKKKRPAVLARKARHKGVSVHSTSKGNKMSEKKT